jgi:hypothetical protein
MMRAGLKQLGNGVYCVVGMASRAAAQRKNFMFRFASLLQIVCCHRKIHKNIYRTNLCNNGLSLSKKNSNTNFTY